MHRLVVSKDFSTIGEWLGIVAGWFAIACGVFVAGCLVVGLAVVLSVVAEAVR